MNESVIEVASQIELDSSAIPKGNHVSDPLLAVSRRIRATPFTTRVEESGVTTYTSYNHMLLPAVFESYEADYWHLCEHVQVWDVSCERQVEIRGPDSARLVQLMTPRNIAKADQYQCLYVPLCDCDGGIINDPIAIKLAQNHWWLSIADSDVLLWARGLATGYGLDASVHEPNVNPLAVQGPKAETLMRRVFGDEVSSIRFFRGKMLPFEGHDLFVARSGWSKQGGFEIYLDRDELALPLWDSLCEQGKDLNVRAGCPNAIERLESGLLSYGNDMSRADNPFECGLDAFIDIDDDIESLSAQALRDLRGRHKRQLVGIVCSCETPLPMNPILDQAGNEVGSITSQAWSPRYRRRLAFAMLDRSFLEGRKFIEMDGNRGRITNLPFSSEALQQPLEFA